MIEIRPPRFPKGITKNRTPKSIIKKTPKFNQLDGCEDIPENIGSTTEENEDLKKMGEDETVSKDDDGKEKDGLDQIWEDRVLSCHNPYFIPGFMCAPPPSPNELEKKEDKGDVVNEEEDEDNNGREEDLEDNKDNVNILEDKDDEKVLEKSE